LVRRLILRQIQAHIVQGFQMLFSSVLPSRPSRRTILTGSARGNREWGKVAKFAGIKPE
jgi:hypothetical protein